MSNYDDYNNYDWFYERRARIKPVNGIKSKSKRGNFVETWWGEEWMDALDSDELGVRLGRGKGYARRGQVVSIEVEKGGIYAEVQGSEKRPYRVSITFYTFDEHIWNYIIKVLSTRSVYSSILLTNAMPHGLDSVVSNNMKVPFFPQDYDLKRARCTCRGWPTPCKHIIAVYCLVAEEFDRDPFLLFKLRGLTREEFFEMMSGIPSRAESPPSTDSVTTEPLSNDVLQYWRGEQTILEDLICNTNASSGNATIIKQLGDLPFWKSDIAFVEVLEPIYKAAAKRAKDILNSEEFGL